MFHIYQLRSAQLFRSQYADCKLWLFPFLFVFFFNPTRTRLSVVWCAIVHDTWQYLEHNKLQAPEATSSQHVTHEPWCCFCTACLHHKFSARSLRTLKTIQNPKFVIHFWPAENVCVDCRRQNSKRSMQIFITLRCNEIFFFNVILIIAGFATREDLFELIFGIFFPFYLRSPSPSFRLARYPWLWLLTTRFCRWLSPSYGHRSIQQHPGDDDDDASTIAAHYEKDVTMSKTKIG